MPTFCPRSWYPRTTACLSPGSTSAAISSIPNWRATASAAADGVQGTDDAELVERIGGRVVIVPDQPTNLKLTTQADFALAEALLRVAP